ncbi:MAG: hypothetical protein VKJ02_12105 [Snowella sp.]|nr:hypothetical protein [Snowella sp.]
MKIKAQTPRQIRKFERRVSELIELSGGIDIIFKKFKHRPSKESLIKMFISGEFGVDNPLLFGGIEFALEYAFDEFNGLVSFIKNNWRENLDSNIFDHDKWDIFFHAQNEPWANLLFSVIIDKTFTPFVSNLKRKEFIRFTDKEEELIHEQTRSIVFDLKLMDILSINDDFIHNLGSEVKFRQNGCSSSYVYWYGIWISSPELYEEQERDKHTVKSHKRHLASGKVINVRSHERRNRLLEAKVPWDDFNDYIVYQAYDINGILRYIGEGRPDRYLHINSGVSHNYKINEHYFVHGKMDVKIVKEGLSKPEALAIEKFLIGRYSKGQLWNIKDNPILLLD